MTLKPNFHYINLETGDRFCKLMFNPIPMKSIAIEQKENTIEWKQMWSLTVLYASIVIGWIAYQQYQPQLLVRFNFTDFALALTVAQGIILVFTPLIAGRLGDRYRFTTGNRIPVISAGISFAAMVFMAVAFTLLADPGEIFRWVLPVLIICWLFAMSLFTSPALSTIETFIPVEKLPKAMAVLTITANLLYSLEPVIVDIINFLGAPVTFIFGGMIVFVSGFALKKNALTFLAKQQGREDEAPADQAHKERTAYGYIFILGAVLGLATTWLFSILPGVLDVKFAALLNGMSSKIILVGVLVVSGSLSLPFSNLTVHYGIQRSFWHSSLLTVLSIAGVFMVTAPFLILLLLVLFAIGFSVLSVSSLPLAISKANYFEKVFCVGIFFSGVALPEGIVEVLLLL